MFIFFPHCISFQFSLILMEVKYAQWKENYNINLEAPKTNQAVSSLFSTKHVFTLINWLQEEIPFQVSHTVKKLNHSIADLNLFTMMGKPVSVHLAALVVQKEQVKEYFNPSHFPLVIKSRAFKQKVRYTFTVKLNGGFFFTVDRRANMMTVSRLKRNSL